MLLVKCKFMLESVDMLWTKYLIIISCLLKTFLLIFLLLLPYFASLLFKTNNTDALQRVGDLHQPSAAPQASLLMTFPSTWRDITVTSKTTMQNCTQIMTNTKRYNKALIKRLIKLITYWKCILEMYLQNMIQVFLIDSPTVTQTGGLSGFGVFGVLWLKSKFKLKFNLNLSAVIFLATMLTGPSWQMFVLF